MAGQDLEKMAMYGGECTGSVTGSGGVLKLRRWLGDQLRGGTKRDRARVAWEGTIMFRNMNKISR